MDGQTDRESNTLDLRGLEESAHALRGLEEPFFQLCCCVSFWFWREIGFGCTYYYVLGVPYNCFLLWGESFITTGKKVLVVCLAGCAVVSVFGSGRK